MVSQLLSLILSKVEKELWDILASDYVVHFFELEGVCQSYFRDLQNDFHAYDQLTQGNGTTFISSRVSREIFWFDPNFSFLGKDWTRYDVIIFPALNINPQESSGDFWTMCKLLFRWWKLEKQARLSLAKISPSLDYI